MASPRSLLPMRGAVESDTAPETVGLEEAGDVMEALTSATARTLLARVYESPATASDLASAADTSVQNVEYHLQRLREVGVVEVADTWYSEKGNEMNVYGPTSDPLVIVAGSPDDEADVQRAVSDTQDDRTHTGTAAVRPDGGRPAVDDSDDR